MLLTAPKPQLTPLLRQRMKERFPGLKDEDLPLVELSDAELITRIARCTHGKPASIRRTLYDIGVLIRPRPAGHAKPRASDNATDDSLGSGVPDDTGQSGMMGLGPGW